MSLKRFESGASWPTSGAATTTTSGFSQIPTGGVHVGSDDIPPSESSTGYIEFATSQQVRIGLNSTSEAFDDSDFHMQEIWVRFATDPESEFGSSNARLVDLNGDGIRVITALYERGSSGLNVTMSPISTAGDFKTLDGQGASGSTAIIPLDEWVRIAVSLNAATGTVRVYVNRMLVSEHANMSLSGTASLKEISSHLLRYNGCKVQVGPARTFREEPGFVPDRWIDSETKQLPVTFAGRDGSHWPSLAGNAEVETVTYATGGTNPNRSRLKISNGSVAIRSVDASPVYSESGWCSYVFPMMMIRGESTLNVRFIDVDEEHALSWSIQEGTVVVNGYSVSPAFADETRLAVVVHVHRSGTVTATVIDQSNSGGSQYVWSKPCGNIQGQIVSVEMEVVAETAGTDEVDGLWITSELNVIGVDSLTEAAVNGINNMRGQQNNVSGRLGFLGQSRDAIPKTSKGTEGVALIIGRSGRTRESMTAHALESMTWSRGLRYINIDGGSVNDMGEVTAANRNHLTFVWAQHLRQQIELAAMSDSRIWLSTMIRRPDHLNALQNSVVDERNGITRQMAAELQRYQGLQPLIEISDVAAFVEPEELISEDNVHFHGEGNQKYADRMHALAIAPLNRSDGNSLGDGVATQSSIDQIAESVADVASQIWTHQGRSLDAAVETNEASRDASRADLSGINEAIASVSVDVAGMFGSIEVTRNVYLQTVFETLELVRGDHHNGIAAPKLTWPTDKKYVEKPVSILIFDDEPTTPLATGTGIADGNTITIDDLQCDFDAALFRGRPRMAKLFYAVVAGTTETLRYGPCNVHFRPDID